jgi:hypothetical protein
MTGQGITSCYWEEARPAAAAEDEEEGQAAPRKVGVVEGMINGRRSWNSTESRRGKAANGKSGAWRNCNVPSCI